MASSTPKTPTPSPEADAAPDLNDPQSRPRSWFTWFWTLLVDCLIPLVQLAWIGAAEAVRLGWLRLFQWHRDLDPDTWRWSWGARVAFFIPGVIIPIVCFFMAAGHGRFVVGQPWQSGELRMYAWLLLDPLPASAFFPHLGYSMICLTLLVIDPAKFSRYFVVRLGIYAGALLAVQYLVIVFWPDMSRPSLAMTNLGFLALGVLLAVVTPLAVLWPTYLVLRAVSRWNSHLVFLVGAAGLLMLLLAGGPDVVRVPAIFAMVFGTPWAVGAYGIMALYLLRYTKRVRLQFSLTNLLAVFTWAAAYFGSWRVSINLMLEEYAKLPMTNPNCYVATAAARGHRRLVGSRPVVLSDGRACRVNDQMRWLKCGELVLRHCAPAVHWPVRAIYDRLGTRLARRLAHPLLADAAYLALKLAEWAVRGALLVLLPGVGRRVRGLYEHSGRRNR